MMNIKLQIGKPKKEEKQVSVIEATAIALMAAASLLMIGILERDKCEKAKDNVTSES